MSKWEVGQTVVVYSEHDLIAARFITVRSVGTRYVYASGLGDVHWMTFLKEDGSREHRNDSTRLYSMDEWNDRSRLRALKDQLQHLGVTVSADCRVSADQLSEILTILQGAS